MVRRRPRTRKKPAYGGSPAKKSNAWIVLVLGALVVVNLYVFVWDKKTSIAAIKQQAELTPPAAALPQQPLEPPAPVALPTVAAPAPVPAHDLIEGKVGKNSTLGKLLRKSLGPTQADEVIRAVNAVWDATKLRAGETYRIQTGPDGRVLSFELVLGKTQTVRVERDATGKLIGKSTSAQTHVELATIGGTIESSLYAAIKKSGEDPALVDFFVDVFAYDLDFYNDTQEGDTFRAVVEKELKDDGSFLRYKRILAAQYKGKAGTFETFYWSGKYFEAGGESAEKALLKTPLKFTHISSGFDRKRFHPVLHEVRAHLGIDYAAPTGTPVWAAAAGTITFRGDAGGAGNMVMIKHDSGIETAYMHLSKFADRQEVGQRVEAKTVIGFVGATGLATGPHLHFGVKENGEFIDPTKLSPIQGKPVPQKELEAFRTEVGKLEAMLASFRAGAK